MKKQKKLQNPFVKGFENMRGIGDAKFVVPESHRCLKPVMLDIYDNMKHLNYLDCDEQIFTPREFANYLYATMEKVLDTIEPGDFRGMASNDLQTCILEAIYGFIGTIPPGILKSKTV